MKADIEKTVPARVAAAFEDILAAAGGAGREQILQGAESMVRAVWLEKIYAALPRDKTTVPEYFLDAELEQFLGEAVAECHERIAAIAQRVKDSL